MVARVIPDITPRISRRRGFVVGIGAGLLPAGLCLVVLLGSFPWFGLTLAIACLGSGGVIGSTLGRSLAKKPDPLGALKVSAIAVAVGDVIAAVIYPIGSADVDSVDVIFGGLLLGIPAYFFLAFPGLVSFILLARRVAPATAP
jgi:hypothetical protein